MGDTNTSEVHDRRAAVVESQTRKRLVHPRAADVSRYLDLRRSGFVLRVLGLARFRALTTNQ